MININVWIDGNGIQLNANQGKARFILSDIQTRGEMDVIEYRDSKTHRVIKEKAKTFQEVLPPPPLLLPTWSGISKANSL